MIVRLLKSSLDFLNRPISFQVKTVTCILLLSSMEFASIWLALFIEEENICNASQEYFNGILLLMKYVYKVLFL